MLSFIVLLITETWTIRKFSSKMLCNFNLECSRKEKKGLHKRVMELPLPWRVFHGLKRKLLYGFERFLRMQLILKGDIAINILQGNFNLPLLMPCRKLHRKIAVVIPEIILLTSCHLLIFFSFASLVIIHNLKWERKENRRIKLNKNTPWNIFQLIKIVCKNHSEFGVFLYLFL